VLRLRVSFEIVTGPLPIIHVIGLGVVRTSHTSFFHLLTSRSLERKVHLPFARSQNAELTSNLSGLVLVFYDDAHRRPAAVARFRNRPWAYQERRAEG
jgi:hypothetical protein